MGGASPWLVPSPCSTADYALISFNYDNVTDDFALTHFDHNGGFGGGFDAAHALSLPRPPQCPFLLPAPPGASLPPLPSAPGFFLLACLQ